MADYDITLKRLSDLYPADFAELLIPGEAITEASYIKDREINLLLRKVDYLYKVRSDEGDYIIHLEFQTEHKKNIPRRMFQYAGQITNKYHLPVISGTVYLKETSRNIPDRYDIIIHGRVINSFQYRVIKLWEIESKRIIKSRRLGLLPLIPLMKVSNPEDILTEVNEEIGKVRDKEQMSELLTGAYILSGLRYDKELIKSILKEEIIMQSVTYQDISEKSEKRGEKRGEKNSLLSILRIRFGGVPEDIRERIEGIRETEVLERLLEAAVLSESMEKIRSELRS